MYSPEPKEIELRLLEISMNITNQKEREIVCSLLKKWFTRHIQKLSVSYSFSTEVLKHHGNEAEGLIDHTDKTMFFQIGESMNRPEIALKEWEPDGYVDAFGEYVRRRDSENVKRMRCEVYVLSNGPLAKISKPQKLWSKEIRSWLGT